MNTNKLEMIFHQLIEDLRYCGNCSSGLEECSEHCSRTNGDVDPLCACKLMLDSADAIETLLKLLSNPTPYNCRECNLKFEIESETFCPFFADNIDYWIASERRHEDCPLDPLVPHNRLIDEQEALLALLEAGHEDSRFRPGQTILYSISEIASILSSRVHTVVDADHPEHWISEVLSEKENKDE